MLMVDRGSIGGATLLAYFGRNGFPFAVVEFREKDGATPPEQADP